MSDLEKTHPSLVIKIYKPEHVSELTYSARTMEELLKTVQKHTVDKQVLRKKIISLADEEGHEWCCGLTLEEFFKELGLEE